MLRSSSFLLASASLFILNSVIANDCSTSISIAPSVVASSGTTSGTLASATWSGEGQCAGSGSAPDVWYSFVAPASVVFINAEGSGNLDLVVEVFGACGGMELTCSNDAGPGASESLSLSGLTTGATYYIGLYNVNSDVLTSEDFSLIVGNIPAVELRSQDCDQLDYTTNDIIRATSPGPSALTITGYEWRFEELEAPNNVYELVSPNGTNPNYRLQWFSQIAYGRTYDVSVRVLVAEGGNAGDYGPSCTIGLQSNVLSTQLQAQFANQFYNFCGTIGATPVGAATQYRWEFFDLNNTISVLGNNNSRLLRLHQVPGLQLGQVYIVTAFATVAGDESPVGALRFITMNNFVPNTGLNQSLYPCGGTYPANLVLQANEICRASAYTWRFTNTSQVQPALLYTRSDGNRAINLNWIPDLIPGDSYNVDVRASQGNLMGDYSTICNITIGEPVTSLLTTNDFDSNGKGPTHGEFLTDEVAAFEVSLSGNTEGSSSLQVHVSNELGGLVQLELYDLSGKLVDKRQDTVEGYADVNWALSNLPAGMYLLRAFNGYEVLTQKLVR